MGYVFAADDSREKTDLISNEVRRRAVRHRHNDLRNTRVVDAPNEFERTRSPRDLSSIHFIDFVNHALDDCVYGHVNTALLQVLCSVAQTGTNQGETIRF
jgi:hypothetical protein